MLHELAITFTPQSHSLTDQLQLQDHPELIISLFPHLTKEYFRQMHQVTAELPAEILPWMQTYLAEPQTETKINFDDLHQVFRTLIPDLTFLPDETAINWGKFREFSLSQTNETLIVQPYTILPVEQSRVFRQNQKTALIAPVPDPFLLAVQPFNSTENHYYARLIKKYWETFQLAASFNTQSADFYKQVDQAVHMLSQLAETISQVITTQIQTINLSPPTLALLLYPHYLKAGETLITPLRLSSHKIGLKLPGLS